MRTADKWGFAMRALLHNRLRTALCLLGISIGVTAVVLLTGLGEGARRYVDAQFKSLGTNLVFIFPGHSDTQGAMPGMGGAPNDLSLQDAQALLREVHQLKSVVPISQGSETVANRERSKQVYVVGATPQFIQARSLRLESGVNLPELDWERGKPVIVLGAELAQELFPGQVAVGNPVRVGDRRMRVIGVLEDRGTQVGLDTGLVGLIPVASAMSMYNESGLFSILVELGAQTDTDLTVARIREVLLERHGEEDFTCQTQESVAGSLSTIMSVLTLALAGIASVSLVVAGIGIMNVMLVSVAERGPEVGLLRALGAGHRQVRGIFLAEAALISVVGGLLGLGLAFSASTILKQFYPAFDATPPWWSVLAALSVSTGVGLLFGVMPANKASRLDPVAALRS